MNQNVKNCQSCMMPLAKDDRSGDGLDPRYCSYCFKDGDFVVKNVTGQEFRDQTYTILVEQGWKRPIAWISTRNIPRLPRWKQDDPDQI